MTDTVAAEAPSTGPLSIDDAASLLSQVPTEVVELPPEEQPAGEEAAPEPSETEPEAEPTAEEEPGAETPAEEPEAEQPEPEPVPAIEAPQFWDAEAKTAFKTLTPEQQRIVADQTRAQVAAAAKAIEQAAEARKAAEGQASKVTQLAELLNDFLPKAADTFKNKWVDHDWDRLAAEDPAQYVRDKRQFDKEQEQLQALAVRADEANRLEIQRYQAAEYEALGQLAATQAPELVDPKTAQQSRSAVATYLASNGIQPDRLPLISATEMVIAYKAMKYDEAQAAAKTVASAPKPKPAAKPAPKTASGAIRPTAAPVQAPTRQRNVDNARSALDRSGSVDDAVALLKALRG